MKKKVKLLILVCWMVVIFLLSHETGEVSSQTSDGFMKILFNVLSSIFSIQYSIEDFIINYGHIIRKLAHFSEFFVLGVLAYITIKEYSNKYLLISILFSIFYAISDEVHQLFIQNRAGSIVDVSIDSFGSIIGILICHLIYSKCIKKQS